MLPEEGKSFTKGDDAAVVDFGLRRGVLAACRLAGALDQGSTAGGTPVGQGVGGQFGVAVAAEAFHLHPRLSQ